MKLAASNIGWSAEHLDTMLTRLPKHGVTGLVIAPTMVWPEAPYVTGEQAADFRARVENSELVVAGMQSLTYGLNGAALSGDPEARRKMIEHLKRQAELAGRLGATSLIFGSPGVRKGVDAKQAMEVFGEAARVAADNGAKLCIEPLSGYGNEFVTTSADGVRLVKSMRAAGLGEGFGLHLDSAAIAGQPDADPALDIIGSHLLVGIHSFDASAPELLPPSGDESVNHWDMGAALRIAGYAGFVSLEMRPPQGAENPVEAFINEVDFVRDRY